MGFLLTSGDLNETHRTRMPQSHCTSTATAVSPPSSHPTATLVTDPCLLVRALSSSY